MGPVPITVWPSMKDVGTNYEAITVVTSLREENMGPSFMAGDIVVLAYNLSTFTKSLRGLYTDGNDEDVSSIAVSGRKTWGAVGHVEYSRRTTDGLKIRVSRHRWIKIAQGMGMSQA